MRDRTQSLAVGLVFSGFVAAALAAGIWIGQEQGKLALGVLVTIGLLWAGFAAPLSFFATIYPVVAVVGGIQIAENLSLEKAVVLFGAAGLASGVLLRRFQVARLQLVPLSGVLIWITAFGISLTAFPSLNGRNEVLSFAQKALFGWFVFIALTEKGRLRLAVRLSILVLFIASLFTLAAVITQQDLYYIRASSFARGETFGESLFRGVARSGTGL